MKIDTAIRLIDEFAPGFGQRIVGASSEEIAALEAAATRSLPRAYRDYLGRMGRDDAGASAGFSGNSFGIDALLEYYAHPSWVAPNPYLPIGLNPDESPLAFHTFLADSSLDDPPVVQMDLPGGIPHSVFPQARTLGELVFRYAFSNFYLAQLPLEASLILSQADAETVTLLQKSVEARGLKRHSASEGYASYFVSEAVVVHVQVPDSSPEGTVFVHGRERSDMQLLIGQLRQTVQLNERWFDEKSNMYG